MFSPDFESDGYAETLQQALSTLCALAFNLDETSSQSLQIFVVHVQFSETYPDPEPRHQFSA